MNLILTVARLGCLMALSTCILFVTFLPPAGARQPSQDIGLGWASCAPRHTCDPATAARFERYAVAVKKGDVTALRDLRKALTFWHHAAAMPGLPICLSSPVQVRIAAANTVLARDPKPTYQRYSDEYDRRWLHNRCNLP